MTRPVVLLIAILALSALLPLCLRTQAQKPKYSITGIVVDEKGTPLVKAKVAMIPSPRGWKTPETDKDGRYEITDAPAKIYTLLYTHGPTGTAKHEFLYGVPDTHILNVVIHSRKVVASSASLTYSRLSDLERILVMYQEPGPLHTWTAEDIEYLRTVVSFEFREIDKASGKFKGVTGELIRSHSERIKKIGKDWKLEPRFGPSEE